MSDQFNNLKHPLLRPRREVIYSIIGLAGLGILLLCVHTWHQHKYTWRPVEIPLQIKAGEVASGSFIAELSEPHELQIEFERRFPTDEVLNKFVASTDELSPLDVKWSVFNNDKIVVEGTCREYLYISSRSVTFAHRVVHKIKRTLLNLPYEPGGTIARGVGRFACKAGAQYDLHVEVGSTIEILNIANPIFGVRINRLFEMRHKPKTEPIAIGGKVALGLSLIAFCWWALTLLLEKNDRQVRSRRNS